MSGSGSASVRGYLLQTIICLLDALQGDSGWKALTLEPHLESDKIDVIWHYPISQGPCVKLKGVAFLGTISRSVVE
jgi:hypothetical protein